MKIRKSRKEKKPASPLTVSAFLRIAGPMRRRGDRRSKDARRVREEFDE